MADAPRDEEIAAPDGPTGSRRVSPAAGMILAVLILVGLAASILRIAGGGPDGEPKGVDLAVPDWRPDARERAALEEVFEARREAAPDPSSEVAESLVGAYEHFNRVDVRVEADPRSRDLADAHADFRQWALSALRYLGDEAYMGLGQTLADDFVRALGRGDVDAMERVGGTFVTHLRAAALIDASRDVRGGAEPIVPIAFVIRWAQVVRDERPTTTLVTPLERRLLLRWKLAANPLVRHERRLRIAAQLRRVGTEYPVTEALAARAADEGLWGEAASLYREALAEHPGDARLRLHAEYAASRAR
ncbi:MAG: hypothetical protein ACQEXJ_13490 [Myxococcota bacterium]